MPQIESYEKYIKSSGKLILGIETSCDETSAAVVQVCGDSFDVKSNIVASQVKTHLKYGGVVPEIASRRHTELICAVVRKALSDAAADVRDINAVAVTSTPGLIGSLLVGVSYAKSFAYAASIPVAAVNHIEAHILANLIENKNKIKFPFLSLVVSGGHSSIIKSESPEEYTLIAKSRDDAAGEAFDKIARLLGLGYPGGPKIQEAAVNADADAYPLPRTEFKDSFDFSFSGIKTAVMNMKNKLNSQGEAIDVGNMAASFQHSVAAVLSDHTVQAAVRLGTDTICLAGGVASNLELRRQMLQKSKSRGINVFFPSPKYCTDNAAMVAVRGYYKLESGQFAGLELNAKSRAAYNK